MIMMKKVVAVRAIKAVGSMQLLSVVGCGNHRSCSFDRCGSHDNDKGGYDCYSLLGTITINKIKEKQEGFNYHGHRPQL